MYKEKVIGEALSQIEIKGGYSISLSSVQRSLESNGKQYGVPISFAQDQIKFGGAIGGYVANCLDISHPDHPNDYFHYLITVEQRKTITLVSIYAGGTSRLIKKEQAGQAAKAEMKSAGKTTLQSWFGGSSESGAIEDTLRSTIGFAKVSGNIAKAAIGGLRSLGGDKEKLLEEKNWYAVLLELIDEAGSRKFTAETEIEQDDKNAYTSIDLKGAYSEFKQKSIHEDNEVPSPKGKAQQTLNTHSSNVPSHTEVVSGNHQEPKPTRSKIPIVIGIIIVATILIALISGANKKQLPDNGNNSSAFSSDTGTSYVEIEDEATINERNAQVSAANSEASRMISRLNQDYEPASFSLAQVIAPVDVEKESPGYVISFDGSVISGEVSVYGWFANDTWDTEQITVFVNVSASNDASAVANLYGCVLNEYYGVDRYDAEEEIRESLLYTDWDNTDLRFGEVNLWMTVYSNSEWEAVIQRVSGSTTVTASELSSSGDAVVWNLGQTMCNRIDNAFGTPIASLTTVDDYTDGSNGNTICIEFSSIANGYCNVGGHMANDNSSFIVEYIEACTDIEYEEPYLVFEAIVRGVYGVDDDDLSKELYHGCEFCQYPENDGTWDVYITKDIGGRIFLDLGMIFMQVS